jgi:hypothetical protein
MNTISIGSVFYKLIKPTKSTKTWYLKKYTVDEFYITYNSKNEIVKKQWVVYNLCLGQKVYNYEMPTAGIDRAMLDSDYLLKNYRVENT